jgi:O-antigen/teichoic acid export membrane protein
VSGCNLAVGVLVARFLGPEGKGTYTLIITTAIIAAQLTALGMPQAITFFVGRHRWPPIPTFLAAAGIGLSVFGLGVVVLHFVGLLRYAEAIALDPEHIPLLWWTLLLWVPLNLIGTGLAAVLRGRELIAQSAWPGMVGALTKVSLIALLFGVWQQRTVEVVLLGCVLNVGSVACLQGASLLRALRRWGESRGAVSLRILSYGVQNYAWGILLLLYLRIDLYVVGYLLDRAAVGIYSVAAATAELVTFPVTMMTPVLFARLCLLDDVGRRQAFMRVHRATMVVNALAVTVSVALIAAIPAIYGWDFRSAVPVAWLCLAGRALMAQGLVIHNFFCAEDRVILAVLPLIAANALLVSLGFGLIPHYGLLGAGGAVVVSSVVAYVMSVTLSVVLLGTVRVADLVPRRTDVRVLMDTLRSFVKRGPTP